MDIDTRRFALELRALGLILVGCDSDGNVTLASEEGRSLANLVTAAHGKALVSAECQAIRAAVTDGQWDAYQEARKATVREAREFQYREKTDSQRLKLDEDYEIGSVDWNTGLTTWKNAKNAIRTNFPYPE